jgi:serine/threonine protein kinase
MLASPAFHDRLFELVRTLESPLENRMIVPDDALLRRFLLGQLSAEESTAVESYIEGNPDSAESLGRLSTEDSFTSNLRGRSGSPAIPQEAELLASRLEDLAIDGTDDERTRTASDPGVASAATITHSEDLGKVLAPSLHGSEIGRLGEYLILRVLGEGGMGLVFEAEDMKLGRRVAVKIMRPSIAQIPTAKIRFVREAKAAAAIQHENVIPIHVIGEDRDVPFLVMPYLKGESLDSRLKRDGTLPVPEIVRIGSEIASGLTAAHDRGLIHRDIKPANIWLESPGDRVKILDFGLARDVNPELGSASDVTQTGGVVGTPAYMSPEQGRGRALDARSDLFSLGGVLYRMATGRLPFEGADPGSVLMALASDTPPAPHELNPAVSMALSSAIMSLLEKHPEKRPSSAGEVARLLVTLAHVKRGPSTAKMHRRPRRRVWAALAAGAAIAIVFLYSSTLFRLATNKGKLVVSVPDSNVEVVIRSDATTVINEGRTRDREFILDAGSYQVDYIDGETGQIVRSDGIGLGRGDRVTSVLSRPEIEESRKIFDSASRKALRWVLVNGGRIRLKAGDWHYKLSQDDAIPGGNSSVVSIDFTDSRGIMIHELVENLRNLPPVTGDLTFAGTDLTNEAIASLATYPNLIDADEISLERTKVTDDGLIYLKRFLKLRRLKLGGTKITDSGLKWLRGQNLASLDLRDCEIRGYGLSDLDGMGLLRELNLSGTHIEDSGLPAMKGLHTLEVLALNYTAISDLGLANLPAISSLRELHLAGVGVTAKGLAHLRKYFYLRLVTLFGAGAKVDDAGLDELATCRALTSVDVRGTAVTGDGVERLAKALPYCKIEWDGGTREPRSPLLPGYLPANPPAKDLFAGKLILNESFDDLKSTALFTGKPEGVTYLIEEGHCRILPSDKSRAVAYLGPPLSDYSFAIRVRTDSRLKMTLRNIESKGENADLSESLSVNVEPDGQWQIMSDKSSVGKPKGDGEIQTAYATQSQSMLGQSNVADPQFAAGQWVALAGRFVGDDYEFWINGKLAAHGTVFRGDRQGERKYIPGAPAIRLITERTGEPPGKMDIDDVAIWVP